MHKVVFYIKTIGGLDFLFSTKTMAVFLWICVSAPKKTTCTTSNLATTIPKHVVL